MVARALSAASVFLGDAIDEVVYEDREISRCLDCRDLAALSRVVGDRNTRFDTWGFKKPNIHDFVNPKRRSCFRNPHYIFTFRDPVAIAKRYVISELFEEAMSLGKVVGMQERMARFILRLRHPVLLLSYEKAIQAPLRCVESIIDFTDLHVDEVQKQGMLASIEPNRTEYLMVARRVFEGYVDGIDAGVLSGWCRQIGSAEPIQVAVFVNERHIASTLADTYRDDLAAAGIGMGEHGFRVSMKDVVRDPNVVVRVFASGRSFELQNSGKTIEELYHPR